MPETNHDAAPGSISSINVNFTNHIWLLVYDLICDKGLWLSRFLMQPWIKSFFHSLFNAENEFQKIITKIC